MGDIPQEQFADKFTRVDDILVKMLPLLERLNAGDINVNLPEDASMAELVNLLEYEHDKNYEIHFFTYPNDGSRASLSAGDTVLNFGAGTIKATDGNVSAMSTSLSKLKKDFLRSISCSADKDIVLQLDSNDKIFIRADSWFVGTYQQFTKATITTTETTDFSLLCCTNPEAITEAIGESTVSVGREEREQIKSDKDTHFSGAILQNAIEEENLTGLTSDEITITGVSIIADEALSYRVWFFETDDFQETDLDNDEFIEFVDVDIAGSGGQIAGTGAYYYAHTALNIDYEDLDGTNELHIALQNLSAGAKTAGAAGEVVMKISYIPRT